jgi:hypothetical protein
LTPLDPGAFGHLRVVAGESEHLGAVPGECGHLGVVPDESLGVQRCVSTPPRVLCVNPPPRQLRRVLTPRRCHSGPFGVVPGESWQRREGLGLSASSQVSLDIPALFQVSLGLCESLDIPALSQASLDIPHCHMRVLTFRRHPRRASTSPRRSRRVWTFAVSVPGKS